MHKFEAPPTLVEQEFNNVWITVVASDLKSRTAPSRTKARPRRRRESRLPQDRRPAGPARPRARRRSARRTRSRSPMRKSTARCGAGAPVSRPGTEVWDYYQKNPDALASVRAPIYEEKVVDLILVSPGHRQAVSKEELYKEDEDAAAEDGDAAPSVARSIASGGCRIRQCPLRLVAGRERGGSLGSGRGCAYLCECTARMRRSSLEAPAADAPHCAGQDRLTHARSRRDLHELSGSHGGRADQPWRAGLRHLFAPAARNGSSSSPARSRTTCRR